MAAAPASDPWAARWGAVEHFVDVAGASGTVYQFRPIAQPAQLPATAGNFLIQDGSPNDNSIICCGTALSLLEVVGAWKAVLQDHPAGRLFVRLNVSRNLRVSEYDDIVARHSPCILVVELDQAQPDAGSADDLVRTIDRPE